MSLQAEIDSATKQMLEQIPQETTDALMGFIEKLKNSQLGQNAPKVGDKAPVFSLPTAEGNTVELSQKLEKGPVVISFYRGTWCPYCSLELKALADAHPQIRQRGASLVAISPE
ncbi:MAG: peroxiredoxin family protein, partial [Phycisphaeraceae bacterium]|nr:peroxiredoxin family protein [Phycisphaeraceae bacterium]